MMCGWMVTLKMLTSVYTIQRNEVDPGLLTVQAHRQQQSPSYQTGNTDALELASPLFIIFNTNADRIASRTTAEIQVSKMAHSSRVHVSRESTIVVTAVAYVFDVCGYALQDKAEHIRSGC